MNEFVIDTARLTKCCIDLSKVPDGTVDFSGVEGYAPSGSVVVVSWFPAESIRERGLPAEAICGIVQSIDSDMTEDSFVQNRQFVDTLHEFNQNYPAPELIQFALSLSGPGVAVIDERLPDVRSGRKHLCRNHYRRCGLPSFRQSRDIRFSRRASHD